jgi:hypothetical protein
MRNLFQKLLARVELFVMRRCQVAEFEGILLSDFRGNPLFRDTLLGSLRLLKDIDARRFERVRRRVSWVVNLTLDHRDKVAFYLRTNQKCVVEFLEPSPEDSRDYLIGLYAVILVHEATHGELFALGIPYTKDLRSRIERICVLEEQRFLARLSLAQPDVADKLYVEFDPADWEGIWRTTRLERFLALFRRSSRE